MSRLLAVLLLAAAALGAQETRGFISGRVLDASGAVVPRATVTARHQATNVKVTAASNEQGSYLLPYLPPGSYKLTAQANGFKTYTREGVELRMDDRLQIDITLELGAISESVTVSAETPLLQATNASLGQVIEQRSLTDLPVLHSNPMLLMQLSPAAVSVATNMTFTDTRSGDNARLTEFAMAGTFASTHEITMDGASNTTTGGGTSSKQRTIAFIPPSDIVNEFKVETASYDASVASAPGGLITISLKSGSNSFHGTTRYFKTNPGWNANDFFGNKFGRPRSYLKNYHWVASGSGPIVIPKLYDGRNRTFFMYGYEKQKDDAPWAGSIYSVPTLPQRGGDFSALLRLGPQYQIYDPGTARLVSGRVNRSVFPNNIVPASRFSPTARKIMEYIPNPRAEGLADGSQNYPYPDLLLHSTIWSHTGRIDHNFSDKLRTFFRAYWGDKIQIYRDYFENISTGLDGGFKNRGLTLDNVYTFSPNMVMNVRYGITRHIYPHWPKSMGMDLTTLGFPASLVKQLDPKGVSFPAISISGLSTFGNEKPDDMNTTTHHFSSTVDWVRGSQVVKFGVDCRSYQENYYRFSHAAPTFTFGTTYTSGPLDNSPASPGGVGQGFASFLLGIPTGGGIDRNASYAVESPLIGMFVQNDWRVSQKLTVNLGVRYEVEGALTERFNRSVRDFDTTTVNPMNNEVRTAYAKATTPELPLDRFVVKGGLRFAGVGGNPRGLFETPKRNFAPRLGFAYQLDPKTVIRGGYGIFFGFVGQQRGEKVKTYGFDRRTNYIGSLDGGLTFVANLENPFPGGVEEPVGAKDGLNTYIGNSIAFFLDKPSTPYNQRWSFGFQHTFPGAFMLEAGYVGSRSTRLEVSRDLRPFDTAWLSRSPVRDQARIDYWTLRLANPFYPLLPGTGLAASVITRDALARMVNFPQFTGVSATENTGYSWYHGLETRLERRFSRGFTLQTGYTWSKFMEATSRLNGQLDGIEEVISSQDRPHRFTLSGIYELPFGQGKRFDVASAFGRRLISGWQVQWLYVGQSGPPLGFGNALITGNFQDIVLPKERRTPDAWFNTAPFNRNVNDQLSYNYRTVSSRFNNIRADGRNFWNLSLLKSTQIYERVNLQIRAEFFNALNHAHFAAPNTTPTNTAFGLVSGTTTNPRLIQLGLKLGW